MSLRFSELVLGCLTLAILLGWPEPSWAQQLEEGEVETLEVIEIPGTVVNLEEHQLVFSKPGYDNLSSFPHHDALRIQAEFSIPHDFEVTAVARDQTAKTKAVRKSVKPIRAERPHYPRFAREQGWEGTVTLRLAIGPDGNVSSATTRKSSGYPILDESAVQAVQQWKFQPAKNGEFPIAAKVDLPIRFDLDR